jgi:NAD(P)-dependent dehydrogenase (short-subunit alcohol dehydrogenase family)
MSDEFDSLRDRVAIVVGGASGIGRATVALLAGRGAQVVVADADHRGAVEVAAAFDERVQAVVVDVRDEQSVTAMARSAREMFGGIDLLVNCAAATGLDTIARDVDLIGMALEAWQTSIDVNLSGSMLACRACLPLMIERGGGAIVNMVSVGALAGNLGLTAYAASKGGLVALTRSIATQYGHLGIRCNAIAAGFVRTPSTTANLTDAMAEIVRRNTLVGFLGEADDVARVILFLLSSDSRYITGEVIRVDGGQLAHTPTYDALRAAASGPTR